MLQKYRCQFCLVKIVACLNPASSVQASTISSDPSHSRSVAAWILRFGQVLNAELLNWTQQRGK